MPKQHEYAKNLLKKQIDKDGLPIELTGTNPEDIKYWKEQRFLQESENIKTAYDSQKIIDDYKLKQKKRNPLVSFTMET